MDRGILMTGPMVLATQEDRKTQTRRVVTERDCWRNGLNRKHSVVSLAHAYQIRGTPNLRVPYRHKDDPDIAWEDTGAWRVDPLWKVGDKLYVKETHYRYGRWLKNGKTKTGTQAWRFIAYSGDVRVFQDVFFLPDCVYAVRPNSYRKKGWYTRSALFMPKKLARLWLEITAVRVERLDAISQSDALAEGIEKTGMRTLCMTLLAYHWNETDPQQGYDLPRMAFAGLWDSINAKRGYGWEVNPWVWVVEFKKVEG